MMLLGEPPKLADLVESTTGKIASKAGVSGSFDELELPAGGTAVLRNPSEDTIVVLKYYAPAVGWMESALMPSTCAKKSRKTFGPDYSYDVVMHDGGRISISGYKPLSDISDEAREAFGCQDAAPAPRKRLWSFPLLSLLRGR